MGGNVALQLQEEYTKHDRQSLTHHNGDRNADINRFRHAGGYISMFEHHAKITATPDMSDDRFVKQPLK